MTDPVASPPPAVALRKLFPALAEAAPATLARIVEHGIHRKVPAGTTMFDAHSPCGGFPLVLSGTVKVLQRYPNGREMPLYKVRPGESCLLSGSCLLGHSDYTASGIAETDVEVLVVPPGDFHALIASDEAFRNHVFSLFGERLATLMSLVEAIAYQKLDQRLASLLLAKGDIGARNAPGARGRTGQRARNRQPPAARIRGQRLGRPGPRTHTDHRSPGAFRAGECMTPSGRDIGVRESGLTRDF